MRKQSTWKTVSIAFKLIAFGLILPAFAHASEKPLEVVPYVDLNRYVGKWYEIASFPQRFQKGCVATTATYTLRQDGDIDVLNECRDKTLDGKLRQSKGLAWVTDPSTHAKLRVRFFWPFSGKYWIIGLGKNYEYAIVGHPDREYLWILSRTPVMSPQLYDSLVKQIQGLDFDVSRLVKTLQPPQSPSPSPAT